MNTPFKSSLLLVFGWLIGISATYAQHTMSNSDLRYQRTQVPLDYNAPPPDKKLPSDLNVRALELAIIKELNIVRANPVAYANEMAKLKFEDFASAFGSARAIGLGTDALWYCYDGDKSCETKYMSKLQVAIDFLRKQTPLSPLTENTTLAKAARLLAADTGEIDGRGHKDSQGRDPWARAAAVGYQGTRGECLNAGHVTAAGFIISFLTSPGHRDILLKERINEVGVDLHKHGSGDQAFLRDVIMVGQGSGGTSSAASTTEAESSATQSGSSSFSLEYVSGAGQSYSGGGMPQAMVFKIKEKATGSYITDLRAKGLSFEVKANKEGKYDGRFNNLNNYCKNGDKGCFGGYYYVPSNRGSSPYTLQVTVMLKKDGKTLDSYVVEQNIR